MDAMTKSWTDERLEERFDRIDERFDAIDRRFDRVDADFRELRGEMHAGSRELRGEMHAGSRELRGEMHAGFDRIDARFDALQHLLIRLGGVVIAALLGLIATQL
jgi:hypothetical protein